MLDGVDRPFGVDVSSGLPVGRQEARGRTAGHGGSGLVHHEEHSGEEHQQQRDGDGGQQSPPP
jgi:hypothetical protein